MIANHDFIGRSVTLDGQGGAMGMEHEENKIAALGDDYYALYRRVGLTLAGEGESIVSRAKFQEDLIALLRSEHGAPLIIQRMMADAFDPKVKGGRWMLTLSITFSAYHLDAQRKFYTVKRKIAWGREIETAKRQGQSYDSIYGDNKEAREARKVFAAYCDLVQRSGWNADPYNEKCNNAACLESMFCEIKAGFDTVEDFTPLD